MRVRAFSYSPSDMFHFHSEYLICDLAVWFCCQLLMIPMIMSVLYVWAQLNKDTIVTFWFGTQFKVARLFSPAVRNITYKTVSDFNREMNICGLTPSHDALSSRLIICLGLSLDSTLSSEDRKSTRFASAQQLKSLWTVQIPQIRVFFSRLESFRSASVSHFSKSVGRFGSVCSSHCACYCAAF